MLAFQTNKAINESSARAAPRRVRRRARCPLVPSRSARGLARFVAACLGAFAVLARRETVAVWAEESVGRIDEAMLEALD